MKSAKIGTKLPWFGIEGTLQPVLSFHWILSDKILIYFLDIKIK